MDREFLQQAGQSAGQLSRADRRAFLKTTGATVAGAMLMGGESQAASAATPIAGKDPRLIEHTAAPAVYETPTPLLADSEVTPTSLLFVRNNTEPSNAVTIKPLPLAGWKIELAGLIDRRQSIDARMLAGMEQVDCEMVLQCSGNSRALFSAAAPVSGTQWGRGAMGNVRFTGVPLASLVKRLGIRINPSARFLAAEGTDEPAEETAASTARQNGSKEDFEHSLPLDEALSRSILALSLGGRPLPAIHGGPVRLVTPGYYGTMQIKWLNRLRFEAAESDHTAHIPRYRTPLVPIKPGAPFEFNYANSEPNWRMKLKCVVLDPVPGAKLPAGDTTIKGVAFNDGEAKIDAVLVSLDEGASWQRAELHMPKSPYAWYRWKIRLRLSSGKQQIWAQAIDALGRGQPADGTVYWNPRGYTWNGVEKIDVTAG